jgi:Uma2 family endonuclease
MEDERFAVEVHVFALVSKLDDLFHDRPDVFVAGDVQWYPVESSPLICQAPDAMVVFGRPKGRRKGYLQWVEGNIPPKVVFEVGSSAFHHQKLMRKFQFYKHYGVEEYYLYDPDRAEITGWQRVGLTLEKITDLKKWLSPLLGIGFRAKTDELHIIRPKQQYLTAHGGVMEQIDRDRHARELAEQKYERLAAQLRALGVNPEA